MFKRTLKPPSPPSPKRSCLTRLTWRRRCIWPDCTSSTRPVARSTLPTACSTASPRKPAGTAPRPGTFFPKCASFMEGGRNAVGSAWCLPLGWREGGVFDRSPLLFPNGNRIYLFVLYSLLSLSLFSWLLFFLYLSFYEDHVCLNKSIRAIQMSIGYSTISSVDQMDGPQRGRSMVHGQNKVVLLSNLHKRTRLSVIQPFWEGGKSFKLTSSKILIKKKEKRKRVSVLRSGKRQREKNTHLHLQPSRIPRDPLVLRLSIPNRPSDLVAHPVIFIKPKTKDQSSV